MDDYVIIRKRLSHVTQPRSSSHSSLRPSLLAARRDSKIDFLPNPFVFPHRSILLYSNYISKPVTKSAMSISPIVVKQRTVFHRLHKQKQQTLWMLYKSEKSPRWKTFSKGGLHSPHSSTNMENQVLTQHKENHVSWAFRPEPSDWRALLFHICKSPYPCVFTRTIFNFPLLPPAILTSQFA